METVSSPSQSGRLCCVVYVKDTKLNLKKLEDRGWKMIFVGYERGSKAYRAYDPLAKCVTVTRDVVFDESAQWSWTGGEDGGELVGDNMFNVQYRVLHEELGDGDGAGDATDCCEDSGWWLSHAITRRHLDGGYLTPSPGMAPGVAQEEPSDDDLNADHDDTPLQLQAMDDTSRVIVHYNVL
jgi:hypothetical protein